MDVSYLRNDAWLIERERQVCSIVNMIDNDEFKGDTVFENADIAILADNKNG